ncbi:MAG: TatD family hydrolase [Minisyncoccia bacterium]
MELIYFDSHCHPQARHFDDDRDAMFSRMQEKRVGGIVVGTDLGESKAALELARARDFLWAAVGLHPTDNLEESFDDAAYRALAADPKVVAIGECGLDYYRDEITDAQKKSERERFEIQLALAAEINKPLIIHCRPSAGSVDAHEDMLGILDDHEKELKGKPVIHFFTSTLKVAEAYLKLGCYLSFSGVVTFAEYDEVLRAVPLERILTETDSPYAAPVPYRGKRNEPCFVEEVLKKIAAVKNLSLDDAARQIILNSQAVFGI